METLAVVWLLAVFALAAWALYLDQRWPLIVLLLLVGAPAHAREATEPDPLAAETFASAFVWRGSVFSTELPRSDYWGGMAVGQLGVGHMGISVRGMVAGLPGQFDQNDPTTFQSIEGAVAFHLNMFGRSGAVLGPAVFMGKSLAYGSDSSLVKTAGKVTAAAALRASAKGGAAYIGIGTHESLGGICVVGTVFVPLTAQLLAVVDGAVSFKSTSSGQPPAFIRVAMAVRLH